jgi:uncharacterized protein YciI
MAVKTFAIYCTDKPDTAQKRLDARDAHLEHISQTLDNFLIAGPMRDKRGVTVGSLLIVKAIDATDAQQQLEKDPYFDANIWQDIRITEFTPAAGDWIGGKIW